MKDRHLERAYRLTETVQRNLPNDFQAIGAIMERFSPGQTIILFGR